MSRILKQSIIFVVLLVLLDVSHFPLRSSSIHTELSIVLFGSSNLLTFKGARDIQCKHPGPHNSTIRGILQIISKAHMKKKKNIYISYFHFFFFFIKAGTLATLHTHHLGISPNFSQNYLRKNRQIFFQRAASVSNITFHSLLI